MRKLLASVVSLSLVFVVAGCGGGGLAGLIPNTLQGTYTGSGSSSSNSDVYQANLTIGSDGTLSGTITDTNIHAVATVGGNVSALGTLSNGTISVVNSSNVNVGSGTLAGTFAEVTSGQSGASAISATLIGTVSGSSTTFTFSDLVATNPLLLHK